MKKSSEARAFALAATTTVTALSMTLAAAMLSARAQWQMYAAKSAEKNIVETAATAESQDFMHLVRKRIDEASGSSGTITADQLFGSQPFRRVELRGGVARVQGTDKSPLLYKNPDTSGVVGGISSQLSNPSRQSIEIPSLWAPGDPSSPAALNPSKKPLGKDDPFYDMNCRSSFAAVSAYSAPRRENMSSTLGGEGFGNLVVVQTRTFPVSAFTSIQFDSSENLELAPPEDKLIGLAKGDDSGGDQILASFDAGRVYTPGKVVVDSDLPFQAAQIIALSGVESAQDDDGSDFEGDSSGSGGTGSGGGWDLSGELERISNKYAAKYSEEITGGIEEEIRHVIVEKAPWVSFEEAIAMPASERKGLPKDLQKKLNERVKKTAELAYEKDREIGEAKAKHIGDSTSSASSGSPYPAKWIPGSSENKASGGRIPGRKVVIGRFSNSDPHDAESQVRASSENLEKLWYRERVSAFRGTLVSSDNGGTPLIRNSATKTIGSLIDEMSKYADCSVKFELSPPDPVSGARIPVIAGGGLKLRVDTKKPIDSSMGWLGEEGSSDAPFQWKRSEEDPKKGMLIFDPSKLKFASRSPASPSKPFSIFIDTTSFDDDAWPLIIKAGAPTEGISIVSKANLHVQGDFLTFVSGSTGMPSMIVAPNVYACAKDLSSRSSKIEATVVTRAPSANKLLASPVWGTSDPFYPPPVVSTEIVGSAVSWENLPSASAFARVKTFATAPSEDILAASAAPALAPTVGELRISGNTHTTKKVNFAN